MAITAEYVVQTDSGGFPCCYLVISSDSVGINRVESNVVSEAPAIGTTILGQYQQALKDRAQETIDRVVGADFSGAYVSASCMEYSTIGSRLLAVENAIQSLSQ